MKTMCEVCKTRPQYEWTDAMGGKHSRQCDQCHMAEMLRNPDFGHTTFVERCFRKSILFYKIDKTSPSGVILMDGVEATEENLKTLHSFGQREIPGPSRGEMARL